MDEIVEFWDKTDPNAHEKFQSWRGEHWENGYFLYR